jgi:hypothetical protein
MATQKPAKLKLLKSGTGWKLFENDKGWPHIMLEHVRLSFPHFVEPHVGEDAKEGDLGKFKATFLIDKTKQKALKDICVEVINNLLKDNKAKELEADRKFIRNGDTQDRPEYEGMFTVSASNKKRPKLRNDDGDNVDVADIDDVFVSGYYVDALISPYYQDGVTVGKGYGRRVNSTLVAVKFNEKAEAFAGGLSDDDIDDVFGGSTGGGFDDENDDTDDL